jgi:CDP-diacylglycerol--glycerol-3-phosphate 3-phosphatidyltransferase
MNLANLITLLRFPLLVGIVTLLYLGDSMGQLIAAPLILLLILMDSMDGIVARRRREATLAGSMLDVAADRAVEIVLWVVFTHLNMIPFVIPLVFIIRGTLTDTIRNAAQQHGVSPHGMMQTPLGRWLVASHAMRSSYGAIKAAAFVLLALALGLQSGEIAGWYPVWIAGAVATWASLIVCVLRGVPVLVEAPVLFQTASSEV